MKRIGIFTIIVLGLVLAACGGTDSTPTPTLPEAPALAPRDTAAPTETNEITLTDSSGQTLVFPAPPERVVVAGRAGQMIIHALYLFPEAQDRVVAMEQRLQREVSSLPLIDPKLEEKIQFERDAAAEQIAPTQPEIVLMKSYLAEQLGEPLNEIGIPTALMDLESPAQFFKDLEMIGTMFGNLPRVDTVKSFYQVRLDELQDGIAGLSEDEFPRVLLLQYSDRGGDIAFNVPAAAWLQTSMVENAGGDPVWVEAAKGGGWTVVNFEQIASWNPDIIMIINYFGNPDEVVQNLMEDANWSALEATKNNQLYAFPGDFLSWDQPDTRWILGQMWLAKIIHPELFGDWDMLEQASEFYEELYGIDQSTFESEIVPIFNGDIEK